MAEKAAAMEKAGNAGDVAKIRQCTDEMLQQYRGYLPILEPFFSEKQKDAGKTDSSSEKLPEISPDVLGGLFVDMRDALDNLDIDGMESVISKMEQYHYEGSQKELLNQLKNAVDEIDVDACGEIIDLWEENL